MARWRVVCGNGVWPRQLLDYEPRAADQVPLLMSMQENEIALVKAIESGDSDLGGCQQSLPTKRACRSVGISNRAQRAPAAA